MVFNTFSFEPSKKEIFLFYREVPELLEITDRPLPPSLPSLLLCFARRPPYAAGGPRPRRVRGQMDPGKPPASLGLPLGTSPRSHASQTLSRAATPPPSYAAPLAAPPARRRAPQTQTRLPRRYSPRSGAPWPILLLVWRSIMFNGSLLRVCRILRFVKKN